MTKPSQTLRINSCSKPHSFHPHKAVDAVDASICKALYEGLTRVNLKGDVELALANEVEISPCKTRYTFTLKNSVWSNGKKLTSKHFTDSWKAALDLKKERTIQSKKLFIIKNAKKVYNKDLPIQELGISSPNNQTIIIELEHPAPYFLQILSEPAFAPIFDIENEEPTVFNGPFDIEKFEMEKILVLKKNVSYWDAQTVQLNRINIHFISDLNTVFSLYEKGDLDWIGNPFCEIPVESLKHLPNIKTQSTLSPFWLYFNLANDKLKSVNIRKALSYSVDRSEIVNKIVPHQEVLYTIMPTKLSLIDEAQLSKRYTLKNAKKLFQKGLEELGLKKEDISLTLNYSNCTYHEKIAIYLKTLWEKAFGITVILKKDDWNAFLTKLISNDYDIGGYYVCNLYNHPSYLLERFEGGNSSIISKWSDESFRNLTNLARNAKAPFDQLNYLKEAEEILTDAMPVIPLYNQTHVFVGKDHLKNVSSPRFMSLDFKWAYFEY